MKCLSRMTGNCHVRFLGGKAVVTPLTQPIVSADRLYNDYGIRYESRRTHEGRVVKLTLENSGA